MRKKLTSVCAAFMAVALSFSAVPVTAAVTTENIQAQTENVIATTITQEKPAEIPGKNVALNKNVTSNLGIHVDRPITAVTNGIRNSFAQPSSFAQIPWGGEWYVTIDLEKIYPIETVVYGKADLSAEGYPDAYKNNVSSYQVQVSVDNVNWTSLGNITTEPEVTSNDVYFIPQEEVSARYVRMYAPEAPAWKTIDEIEVYSAKEPEESEEPERLLAGFPNVALGGEGSISQPMHQHHNSGNLAVDANLQTYVQANGGQPFDFTLAFPGGERRFNTVVLKDWYNEYYQQDQRIRKFGVKCYNKVVTGVANKI